MAIQAKLKALSNPEDIEKVPRTEPVLVELPAGVDAAQEAASDESADTSVKAPEKSKNETTTPQDDGAETLRQQLAALEASKAEREKDFEAIRQQLAQERAQRTAAEEKASRAETEHRQSTKEFFGSALDGAKAEKAAAKLAWQQAYESGNGPALADAQERLSELSAKLLRLEEAQSEFDRAQEQIAARTADNQTAQTPDVLTSIDQNPNLLPEERKWLKAHPEAIMDVSKNRALGVGYERAMEKKLSRGTPEYFKFLDEFMGYAVPQNGNAAAQTTQTDDGAIVSAPVNRDSASNGQSKSRIMLSPEQRELAASMGVSDVEYARGLLQLQEDKRQNPERYSAGRS